MLRRPALLCALFCAVSCNPKSSLRQKVATIEVDPNPILFQPLAVGKTAAVTVQVKNVGTIDLHLAKDPYVVESDNDGLVEYDTPAMLARDCAGSSRALDTHLTIVPGDCAILVLRYAPLNTTDKDDARLARRAPRRGSAGLRPLRRRRRSLLPQVARESCKWISTAPARSGRAPPPASAGVAGGTRGRPRSAAGDAKSPIKSPSSAR
jgi:hypothetical protein